MSPDNIVQFYPGDELIIVIPPVVKNATNLVCKILWMYCTKFQNVIECICVQIHPADRPTVVCDQLSSHHYLPRDRQIAMEFPIQVRNYAEHHLFSTNHPDCPTITQYWNQGAGINVAICGYTTQLLVLLQLKHLAFLEVYRKTDYESYTND
jgi:hypothetical protein